jgi:hypothetical protein
MAVSGQSKRKRRFHHMKAAPWKAECRFGSFKPVALAAFTGKAGSA